MITIERKIHFQSGRHTRKQLCEGDDPTPTSPTSPAGRVPRVSRLMALAIRLDRLIRDGVVTDQAELARLGHVTRARLTQIMNLLCLAPDIQEGSYSYRRRSVGVTPSRRSGSDRLRQSQTGGDSGNCGGTCRHFDSGKMPVQGRVNQIVARVGDSDRCVERQNAICVG